MADRVNKNLSFHRIIYRLGYPTGLANSRKPVYEKKKKKNKVKWESKEVCKIITLELHYRCLSILVMVKYSFLLYFLCNKMYAVHLKSFRSLQLILFLNYLFIQNPKKRMPLRIVIVLFWKELLEISGQNGQLQSRYAAYMTREYHGVKKTKQNLFAIGSSKYHRIWKMVNTPGRQLNHSLCTQRSYPMVHCFPSSTAPPPILVNSPVLISFTLLRVCWK